MTPSLEVQLLLCDAAQADPGGKVHMLGAGWSVTGSPTAPQAVVALIKVPWDRTNQELPLRLQLLDADGHPVLLPTDTDQPETVDLRSGLEVGRPPGLLAGSTVDASFVMNVPPLPLPAGRYEWRLQCGEEYFSAFFQVQAPPAGGYGAADLPPLR
jgi:hypothetical protein